MKTYRLNGWVGGIVLSIGVAWAGPVEDAFKLCKAIEITGMASECEVKGWGQTVDASFDTTTPEARKICAGLIKVAESQGLSFRGSSAGAWKLRIFSPYSGNRPLAQCELK